MDKTFRRYGIRIQANCMASWLVLNFAFGLATQLIIPALAERNGVTTALLLNFNTYGSLCGVIACLVGGKLCEKVGCKWVISIAAIIAGLNFMFMPYYGVACGVGIMINAVTSIFYCTISTPILLGKWYPRGHAHVMGNCTAIVILGSLVCLPLFNRLINVSGITVAMLVFGAVITIYGVSSIFWIIEDPSLKGVDPDGKPWDAEEKAKFLLLKT